jgi:hypothetical protein
MDETDPSNLMAGHTASSTMAAPLVFSSFASEDTD